MVDTEKIKALVQLSRTGQHSYEEIDRLSEEEAVAFCRAAKTTEDWARLWLERCPNFKAIIKSLARKEVTRPFYATAVAEYPGHHLLTYYGV